MMWRRGAILSWSLQPPVSKHSKGAIKRKRKGSGYSSRNDTTSVRDSFGMTIPEARLRRDGLSFDLFDRTIEDSSRDILGPLKGDNEEGDEINDPSSVVRNAPIHTVYGAQFDRRAVRFQGRAGDVRRFAEIATRAADPRTAPPSNAVAFVRKLEEPNRETKRHATQQPKESTKEDPKLERTEASVAMLRRALRQNGNEALANRFVAASNQTPSPPFPGPCEREETTTISPAKRRVTRRLRRLERHAHRGGYVHPCLHQGGCTAQGGAALCPFALHHAAWCLAWLQTGHCEEAIAGRCPFVHHGAAARSEQIGLFPAPSEVRRGRAWVGALLQMFVDVMVAVVEENETIRVAMNSSMHSGNKNHDRGDRNSEDCVNNSLNADGERILLAVLRHGTAELPVEYDEAHGVVSVDRIFAVSALTADDDNNNDDVADVLHGKAYPFGGRHSDDHTSLRQERNLSSPYLTDEPHANSIGDPDGYDRDHDLDFIDGENVRTFLMHDKSDGEHRLVRVLDAFRGYFAAYEGSHGPRVALCAPLTEWLLRRVRLHIISGTDASLAELSYDASITLLRCRLKACEGSKSAKEHNRNHSRLHPSSFVGLVLLQQLTILAALPRSKNDTCSGGSGECGLGRVVAGVIGRGESTLLSALLATRQVSLTGTSLQAQFIESWGFVQTILSVVALRLLQGRGHFILTQSTLLDVTRRLARDLDARFANPLLRSTGWTPWTDAQMFARAQAAVYTPAEYARAHQPLVAPAFVASTLNAFLIHALRLFNMANDTHGPVSAALFAPSCPKRRCRLPKEALSMLSALQDESALAAATRGRLMADFHSRRRAYMARLAETETREKPRVRRYARNKQQDDRCYDRSHSGDGADNDDDNNLSQLELLLPHGSVAVSADAVALLMVALLKGGAPYRALRLAAAAVRSARMLRRATRENPSHIVKSMRTVHQKVTDGRTGRRRVVRRQVPILRRVGGEKNSHTKPLGLQLQLNVAVLTMAAMVALRMGTAGERLARGIADDCVRGAMADYTPGRCFPTPTAADVNRETGAIAELIGSISLRTITALVSCDPMSLTSSTKVTTSISAMSERRVLPTARLMEVFIALTPSEDRETHSRYERYTAMDPRARVSELVLLAQQYHTARHHFNHAIGVVADIWGDAVKEGIGGKTLSSFFLKELECMAENNPEIHNVIATMRHNPSPSTMEARLRTPTPGGIEYASYIRGCIAARSTDADRMRWAVMSGALLAIDDMRLSNLRRKWDTLLLRNAILLAQRVPGLEQATVRLLLLSDLLQEEENSKCYPWDRNITTALPRYVTTQLQLTAKLEKWIPHSVNEIRRRIQEMPEWTANDSLLWNLTEPLLIQTEAVALPWLHLSFLHPPAELMQWIINHVDHRDKHAVLSLAAWTAITSKGGGTNEVKIHSNVMRLAEKICSPLNTKELKDSFRQNVNQ